MMEGTTEPFWSEDLWAQVGRATPQVRTQRRAALLMNARLEGESKRKGHCRYVGDRT